MPNIKSQKKRVLTNNKQQTINAAKRTKVKNALKKFKVAIASGDVALCEKLLPETISVIDVATKDGIYHQNNASRKVASISKALSDLKAKK